MYYIITEFSKFYKRIAFLESSLKDKLIQRYALIHNQQCFNRVYPYLLKLEMTTTKYKNQFTKMKINNKISETDKLFSAFNTLYFSDTIDLLNEKIFYNDKVSSGFFQYSYKLNYFKNQCKNIKEFRNIISHQNFNIYVKNKPIYVKALVYFEQMLDLKLYDIDINKFNINSSRPSLKDIMQFIYKENENIMQNDKKVIDIFDEIAINNGYTIKSLPSRASIIRTKFKIQADNKLLISK